MGAAATEGEVAVAAREAATEVAVLGSVVVEGETVDADSLHQSELQPHATGCHLAIWRSQMPTAVWHKSTAMNREVNANAKRKFGRNANAEESMKTAMPNPVSWQSLSPRRR
jgi:hypothetical protein